MNLTDAAIQLAEAGWSVFPVDASTKKPRTTHGHLDASSDPEQIRLWAKQFDRGGAIATPTGNGLFVMDIDPRNGGRRPRWAPDTREVGTQSGGTHLHYKLDIDIKSRAGLFGPGVDSKSAGGYVLLPPSNGYKWVDLRPRVTLSASWLSAFMVDAAGGWSGATKLAPEKWYHGIIHDQVVAWAAYFATLGLPDFEVEALTWTQVQRAREAGVAIDNRNNHIDSAIRWVLSREAAKNGLDQPDLS